MNPLDNVIWQALTSRQTSFAQSFGDAHRFVSEVGPLSGFAGGEDSGYEDLGHLAGPGGVVAVFLDFPYQPREGWKVLAGAPLLQMVYGKDPLSDLASTLPILELGPQDSAEMVELATLTKPGPFGPRTHELGDFFGMRNNGRLVAMAGERMKVPGYTEVSAVCTHPDHTGHGYAAALMTRVMQGILHRGEVPFLHVRGDNDRAIAIYKRLGFEERKSGVFVVLRRD